MRLVIKTDRSFFYASLQEEDGLPWTYTQRWLDLDPEYRPESDLRRKYIACILSLERIRKLGIGYENLKLKVEGKLINEQLVSKRSTGTYEIAKLRSELIGLMTRMGVTVERNEIRQSEQTEERG